MKKAQFYGISNTAAYIAFFIVVIIFFAVLNFDKKASEEVRTADFLDYSAEIAFISYLKQRIDLDVNFDGVIDAETNADLLVLGYNNQAARTTFKTRTDNMLKKINNAQVTYSYVVLYPGSKYNRALKQYENQAKIDLPIPGGKGVATLIIFSHNTFDFTGIPDVL